MPGAFSNWGLKTDVHAPGTSIMSTVPWFARQYHAYADTNAAVYASEASEDGTWTSERGGIVVSRASVGDVPIKPDNAIVDTPGERSIQIATEDSPYAFDGDGDSARLTLGKEEVTDGDQVTERDMAGAQVVYLDFNMPVDRLDDAPFASVCAYVTDFDGNWSYV